MIIVFELQHFSGNLIKLAKLLSNTVSQVIRPYIYNCIAREAMVMKVLKGNLLS